METPNTITRLKTLPGAVVAPVGGVRVGVAATVARLAGVTNLERVAVVTVGASEIWPENHG